MTTRRKDTGAVVCGWTSGRGVCLNTPAGGAPRCSRHSCPAAGCAEGKASGARLCDGCAGRTAVPVPPPAVASAADVEAWLASPHVSARVRAKIAKVEAEGPAVAAQYEHFRATGELPAEQAAAVTEEMLDGIGVLGCVVAELKARKIAGLGATTVGGMYANGAFSAADEAALAHNDTALRAALRKFRALGLVVPPALAAATADQTRALPLAATDPAAVAIHRRRKEVPGALPGTPSLQRVIGGLLVLADAAPDGPAKLALNTRLVDELLPLYEDRRATATETTVAAILADVEACEDLLTLSDTSIISSDITGI